MVSGSSLCYLSDFLYLYEGLFIESLFIIAIVLKTISCILYFTVSHRKNPYPVVAQDDIYINKNIMKSVKFDCFIVQSY